MAPCHPPTINPEIIAGVLQGRVTPENGCIKPIAIEPYTTTAANIGTKINGRNITGFMTIGKPNTTGSLTLNSAGKAATFPKALYCFDFAAKA